MKIINANIFREDGVFIPGEIEIDGARFSRVSYIPSGKRSSPVGTASASTVCGEVVGVIDAGGCYAIPGLIDMHLHGCAGFNFIEADRDGLIKMLQYQAKSGVTAICPTTLTLPEDALIRACEQMASYIDGDAGSADIPAAAMLGINLEGPFISPGKPGAQNAAFAIPPDRAMFDRLIEASNNHVLTIAIAPELDGAPDFIKYAATKTVVSIAHTNADYDEAAAAFHNGAKHVTHLYNAMSAFSHRAPNVIGAAFDDPYATVELVCDGVHLHPSATRVALRLFGVERSVIVSDSMEATGLGDGVYELGGLSVRVTGNEARLVHGGNIASSVSNLMDCLRVAVKSVGMPLGDAVRCASVNPARVLGAGCERGRVAEGLYADLVLLDADLNIRAVFASGRRI